MKELKFKTKIIIVFLILTVITLSTKYYGSTDISDYSDSARFFAGKYSADIRSSHSYLYGFINSPFVKIFNSYFFFKIMSLIFLFMIILSVYYISKKDKRVIWLILLSPVVWYMAPWISPIQVSSLCLLWSWYFMEKYSKENNFKFLILSGIFLGLGWAFWDTILFFGGFLFISFMFNKKLSSSFVFIIAILIGLTPRLLLDQFYFGSPFFSLFKNTFGTLTNAFFLGRGTSYSGGLVNLIFFILVFLSYPIIFWRNYKKNLLLNNIKTMIFISLSLLLILVNPQIRYTLVIIPIIIVLISRNLDDKLFKKQIKFSLIVLIIFTLPILLQIFYSFNESSYYDITEILINLPNISLTKNSEAYYLSKDLKQIANDYPNQTFVVGNHQDYYQKLAHLYWGRNINELVSIQDYNLWKENETVIFEKKFEIIPKSRDRRSIWVAGGISRNVNDKTDYNSIDYALSLDENLNLGEFSKVGNYSRITLWKKK